MLQVYHQGKHQCHAKPNIYQNDDYINQALEESDCALGPKQLAFTQMTKEMTRQQNTGEVNMMAIVNIATQLTDSKRIADLKKKISNEVKSKRHSLSSVAELKTCTSTVDNLYISSINDSNMNGRPSYVFKTSRNWQGWPLTWIKTTLMRTHHSRSQHTLMACTRGAQAGKL